MLWSASSIETPEGRAEANVLLLEDARWVWKTESQGGWSTESRGRVQWYRQGPWQPQEGFWTLFWGQQKVITGITRCDFCYCGCSVGNKRKGGLWDWGDHCRPRRGEQVGEVQGSKVDDSVPLEGLGISFPSHAVGCLPGVGQHLERKINFPATYAYDPDTAHGNTEHSLSALLWWILECLRHRSSLRALWALGILQVLTWSLPLPQFPFLALCPLWSPLLWTPVGFCSLFLVWALRGQGIESTAAGPPAAPGEYTFLWPHVSNSWVLHRER